MYTPSAIPSSCLPGLSHLDAFFSNPKAVELGVEGLLSMCEALGSITGLPLARSSLALGPLCLLNPQISVGRLIKALCPRVPEKRGGLAHRKWELESANEVQEVGRWLLRPTIRPERFRAPEEAGR